MNSLNSTEQLLDALADIVEVAQAVLSCKDEEFHLKKNEVEQLKRAAQKVVDPNSTDLLVNGLLQLRLLTKVKKQLPANLVKFVEHKCLTFKQMRQEVLTQ